MGDGADPNCRTTKNHPEQSQRVSAKDWGIEPLRIYVPADRGILPRMTRHKHAQTGLVTPSPLDRWIDATLHVLAMLVLNVASTIRMRLRRPAVNATRQMPQPLPGSKTDTQQQELIAAQQSSPIALILRDRTHAVASTALSRAIVSKDGKGVLTNVGQTPTPSVSLGSRQAIYLPECSALMEATQRIVATKGNCLHQLKTGGGGSPRLRGETEGAAPRAPTPNKNAPT